MSFVNTLVDPAMIISKTLTKSDVEGNITLPKQQVESVLTRMNGATAAELENGKKVVVQDLMEGDTYEVTLRSVGNTRFYFGEGWSIMKHSLDLAVDQEFKIHWDYDSQEFIVLNYSYSLLPVMIPV